MAKAKGPKKVRIPGTNTWVEEGSPEDPASEYEGGLSVDDVDESDESGWEATSELGPRPEPVPVQPPPPGGFPHYYHAYLPNLRVHRGRKDAVKFMGGLYFPKTAEQNARVRKALAKYVPGGNPDRWMGDTPGIDEDMRCAECGYFTRNFQVWKDHGQKTGHYRS